MATWLESAWLSGALVGALVTVMLALVLMWAGEVEAAYSHRDPFDVAQGKPFDERVTLDEDEK